MTSQTKSRDDSFIWWLIALVLLVLVLPFDKWNGTRQRGNEYWNKVEAQRIERAKARRFQELLEGDAYQRRTRIKYRFQRALAAIGA